MIGAVELTGPDAFAAPLPALELGRYMLIARAPGDPERSARPKAKGGRTDKRADKTISKRPRADLERDLLAGLADGVPRSLHRLAVELWDLEGNMVFENAPMDALLDLVERGEVAMTDHYPVVFRRLGRSPR